jgi:hypothetical protein
MHPPKGTLAMQSLEDCIINYYYSNTAVVTNFDKLMLTNLHLFILQKKVEKVSFKLTQIP